MPAPRIASRETWLAARKALLDRERDLTHRRDALNAERRALPWVRVETDYLFDTPDGERRLPELFDGRSQLAVYHFMLAPASDHICEGCALLADHVDAARRHFEQADLSFVAVSRAARADRGGESPDGLGLRLGLLGQERVQLRFRRVLHAG